MTIGVELLFLIFQHPTDSLTYTSSAIFNHCSRLMYTGNEVFSRGCGRFHPRVCHSIYHRVIALMSYAGNNRQRELGTVGSQQIRIKI